MNFADRIKYERLGRIFGDNFRITRLFADYLECYPEIIKKETVEELCTGGISEEEAIVALLSEIFGLNFDVADDRRLIMQYLTPSVRIIDPKKYTDNPYYKTVKIPQVTDGRWELRQESYKPYRGVIVGDMQMLPDMTEIPPLGFFKEEFHFPAVLEDGNEWMTLTPVDLDTCEEAILKARGRVVTFGLGLGYYAFMVSEKESVESITVIEKSADVIRLFERYVLPYFPHRDKVRIVNSDAFEYAERTMPQENFDLAFVDTWRDAGDGAPMYKRMKELEHLSPDTEFLYWIESFLISRLRAERFADIERRIEAGAELSYEQIISELENVIV